MMSYSILRPWPSLLVLGSLLPFGCVDPKSLGTETDDAGSESESADSGEPSTGGSVSATSGASTDDAGTASSGGHSCSPIDIAECMECECLEGEWSCSNAGCTYDCEGVACGESCMMCPADDPDCTAPDYEGICTADGQCVGVPPPELGFCEGALLPGFETELEPFGCADMVVAARDAADERAVVVVISGGLVANAVETGTVVHVELPVTDPSVALEARAGSFVTSYECDDAPSRDEDIRELWLPTSGTVIVDIAPDAMGTAVADVELVDVEIHRVQPGPAPITFGLQLVGIPVGWLPG